MTVIVTLLALLTLAQIAEVTTGRRHLLIAVWAAGVVLAAALASSVAERVIALPGGETLVLAYWVGVGVRGVASLGGAGVVAATGVEADDRQAFWLWVLAAYVAVLAVETVRQVREADRLKPADFESTKVRWGAK